MTDAQLGPAVSRWLWLVMGLNRWCYRVLTDARRVGPP